MFKFFDLMLLLVDVVNGVLVAASLLIIVFFLPPILEAIVPLIQTIVRPI